jgi:hypothetical protein
MKIRIGILGAVAALVACSTTEVKTWLGTSPTRSPVCNQPQCTYKLAVKSCDSTGLEPEYDEILVGKGVHRIHWVITTPGFTFAPADGVHFPGNPREFTEGTRVNPKEFSYKDTNDNPKGAPEKKFKYNVRVLSGGNQCNYDPSVVNE